MRSFSIGNIFLFVLLIGVRSLPLEGNEGTESVVNTLETPNNGNQSSSDETRETSGISLNTPTPNLVVESESTRNEQKEPNSGSSVDPMETSDNAAAASNYDPTIYGGIMSPEELQRYVNQFGAAYPYAAYPAPIYPGFVPPPPPAVYPSPYVVQTGYEGLLIPTMETKVSSDSNPNATPSSVLNHPLNALSHILSTLMMSTIFKIAATIVTAIGMIFFSGAVLNLICNHTPICDISYRAVGYLQRRDTAENMGSMIAEGITPERMRRAADFVTGAIRKYQQLQKIMGSE